MLHFHAPALAAVPADGRHSGGSRGRSRIGVAALAVLLGGASTCDTCQSIQDPRRGNVDRVSDAVLVRDNGGATFLVTANPELQHLRVLNLTTEKFVAGPNVYFPLSVPTGPATARVDAAVVQGSAAGGPTAVDSTRIYALDSALEEIAVIGGPSDPDVAFAAVGDGIATGPAPADFGAFRRTDGVVELWTSLPVQHSVEVIEIDAEAGTRLSSALVDLGPDAWPDAIGIDPWGDTVLVGDARGSALHVVDRALRTVDRTLPIGAPQGAIAMGVVDVGDGLAPTALVLTRDRPAAYGVRLFRPGFREDRVAVIGGVELPALGLAAYLPDQRGDAVVCCRDSDIDGIAPGEATDAFGAVALANGRVLYVTLNGALSFGNSARSVVRFIDDDTADVTFGPITAGADPTVNNDPNTALNLWVTPDASTTRRPVRITVAPVDTYGAPPFVPLIALGAAWLLEWEGALPGLADVAVSVASDTGRVVPADSDVPVDRARAGDRLRLVLVSDDAACTARDIAPLLAAVDAGGFVPVADAFTAGELACIVGASAVSASVEPPLTFVATSQDGAFLGRLRFLDDAAAPVEETSLVASGRAVSLERSTDGLPLRGSRLSLPFDAHIDTFGMDLADSVDPRGNGGGFGIAGYLPTAMVGARMDIPTATTGVTQSARRLIVTTAAPDGTGRNLILTCDDAETRPLNCRYFQ